VSLRPAWAAQQGPVSKKVKKKKKKEKKLLGLLVEAISICRPYPNHLTGVLGGIFIKSHR
jgi:hypothetical protein